MVQKGSDANSFAYQPSIKFSEASGNEYTADYEVTDSDTANKIEKANVTYKDGSITFDKTAVLDKLDTDKKTIQIIFTIKANDQTLKNPETNFTLSVDLKKTKGKLPNDIAKDLVQQIGNLQFDGGRLVNFYEAGMIVDENHIMANIEKPNGKDTFSYSKKTWKDFFFKQLEEKNKNKIPYTAEFTDDRDGGDGKWLFELKLKFSDTDYDLTDTQMKNGIKYKIYVIGGLIDNSDGTKSNVLTWID